jgi:hypothetical protein
MCMCAAPTDWRDIGVVVASAFMVPVFLGGVPTDWRDIGVVVANSRVPYIPLYDSIPLARTVLLASRTLLLKF